MPDLERISRELYINLEPTEEGKAALRREYNRQDQARWFVVKFWAAACALFVVISWLIFLLG